ncbi:MAG: hypothetical protein WCJ25_03845 [Candidatus Moraniibacteriota bacterium]
MNPLTSFYGKLFEKVDIWNMKARIDALSTTLLHCQIDELKFLVTQAGVVENNRILSGTVQTEIAEYDKQLERKMRNTMRAVSELETANQGRPSFADLTSLKEELEAALKLSRLIASRREYRQKNYFGPDGYIATVLDPRLESLEKDRFIGPAVSAWRHTKNRQWSDEGIRAEARLEETRQYLREMSNYVANKTFYKRSACSLHAVIEKELRWWTAETRSANRNSMFRHVIALPVVVFTGLSDLFDPERIPKEENKNRADYETAFRKLLSVGEGIEKAYKAYKVIV